MKLALRIIVVALVAILVFAIAGIAATWAPDRSVDSLKARWAQPPSQFIEVAGMQVHLRDEGPRDDPIPIVLLHGTSASLHTWNGWAQSLSQTRRVIRFDLPAFGLTGPNAQNDYSINSYVVFVTTVMDKLGVQRFVLGGNSLGGQIAWETANAVPARVQRLILVDSAGYAFVPISMPLGFQMARMPVLRNLVEYVLPRGIIQNSLENVYGDPSLVTPALIDRYYELTLRAGNRKALGYRFAQGFASQEAKIKSLKLPTLILWGAKDRLIPPENGQNFARDIAGSKLVVFEALGHVPHEENVQVTLAEVLKFLGTRPQNSPLL